MSACSILDVDAAAGNSFTDSELEETCHLFALQICLFLLLWHHWLDCLAWGSSPELWNRWTLGHSNHSHSSLDLVPSDPQWYPVMALWEAVRSITARWFRTTSLAMEVLLPWATGRRCKAPSQKTHCRRFGDVKGPRFHIIAPGEAIYSHETWKAVNCLSHHLGHQQGLFMSFSWCWFFICWFDADSRRQPPSAKWPRWKLNEVCLYGQGCRFHLCPITSYLIWFLNAIHAAPEGKTQACWLWFHTNTMWRVSILHTLFFFGLLQWLRQEALELYQDALVWRWATVTSITCEKCCWIFGFLTDLLEAGLEKTQARSLLASTLHDMARLQDLWHAVTYGPYDVPWHATFH